MLSREMPQHDGASGDELVVEVAKVLAFGGTAGGAVLRVEVAPPLCCLEGRQAEVRVAGGRKAEVGRCLVGMMSPDSGWVRRQPNPKSAELTIGPAWRAVGRVENSAALPLRVLGHPGCCRCGRRSPGSITSSPMRASMRTFISLGAGKLAHAGAEITISQPSPARWAKAASSRVSKLPGCPGWCQAFGHDDEVRFVALRPDHHVARRNRSVV